MLSFLHADNRCSVQDSRPCVQCAGYGYDTHARQVACSPYLQARQL